VNTPNTTDLGMSNGASADAGTSDKDADDDDGKRDDDSGKPAELAECIQDCIRAGTDLQSHHVGELKVMGDVVDVIIKNNKYSDVEKTILNIYWTRAKELQSSIVKNGKKKKKK